MSDPDTTGEIPRARSLAEAGAYLTMLLFDRGEINWDTEVRIVGVADERRLRFEGQYRGQPTRIDVVAPEVESPLDLESRYLSHGAGRSLLVDAGQWLLLEHIYEDAAAELLQGLRGADPDNKMYNLILRNRRLAAAAAAEIVKFLSEGADAVGDDGFWTAAGRAARLRMPGAFLRTRMEDSVANLRAQIDNWISRYGPGALAAAATSSAVLYSARSRAEAVLYVGMTSCPCGPDSPDCTSVDAAEVAEGRTRLRFSTLCPSCGRADAVDIVIAHSASNPPPDGHFSHAQDGPSSLLDPAEWFLVSEMYREKVSQEVVELMRSGTPTARDRDPQFWAQLSGYMRRSAAAVDEVLKFVPSGAREVPREAFRTPLSIEMRERDPDLFTQDRLRGEQAERHRGAEAFFAQHPRGGRFKRRRLWGRR